MSELGEIQIRPCMLTDLPALAAISTHLGYPTTHEQVITRYRVLQEKSDEHSVYVAERSGDIVGWVHVYGVHLLESDGYAEIGGLVVLPDMRRQGIGRFLMQTAESWATQQRYPDLRLRSGMQRRDEAHLFYERIGYTPTKQSMMFRKVLPPN